MNTQQVAAYEANRKPGKTRSKTGCRTCRIRKVKCDEEKLRIGGQSEPHCRRCSAARIRCEWQGPVPRKKPVKIKARRTGSGGGQSTQSQGPLVPVSRDQTSPSAPSAPVSISLHPICSSGNSLQAANSLTLSPFDRLCLDYLQDSALVIALGKHWPWSTISYAYQRIAVKQPMLMSAILASTASEIHQSRLHDQERLSLPPATDSSEIDGRVHYGRALSGLREALKSNERSAEKVEAIFITLWLLIDYENRFGNGADAINIHIRGIHSLLVDHVVPSLKNGDRPKAIDFESETDATLPSDPCSKGVDQFLTVRAPIGKRDSIRGDLRQTAVPLFLLWTLYFYTPAIFRGPGGATIDNSLCHLFLHGETGIDGLTLEDLYRISRQSPSRFWGDTYPTAAKLDDLENLPGLRLYHHSHVLQFRIGELFKNSPSGLEEQSYAGIVDQIISISEEYDVVLSSTKTAQSCDVGSDGRRVMETMYWASIAFYGTIVYFYLCLRNTPISPTSRLISLEAAVSHVLELSLRLHRSRPRLMVRIPWQLFLAGIATPDRIYQDWVSIRLRELGCYGRNFSRLSDRFDQIIRGGDPLGSVGYLGTLQGALT